MMTLKLWHAFCQKTKRNYWWRITHIFSVEYVHGHMQTKSAFSVIKRQRWQAFKVIWHNSALLPHMDGSRICTTYIESLKVVAVPTSLMCRVSAISALCWLSTQTPSIKNCLVVVVHTKSINGDFSPKTDCDAMTGWQWVAILIIHIPTYRCSVWAGNQSAAHIGTNCHIPTS